MKRVSVAAIAAAIALLCPGLAQGVEINWPEPNWPAIFEPNQLLTLNLEMDPDDWQAILHNSPGPDPPDCILVEIELPAMFWMDGEEHLKIRVAVRRKKSFAFPDEINPQKVALKIDINQYYPEDPNAAPDWHGMKKLSLEANSDSIDLVAEGTGCNLHRMASLTEGYGYAMWHANWVELYVNGDYIGVYVNNEQYDKQYMKHRDMYTHSYSWLYKYADCEPGFVLKVGDDEIPKSPAVEALCYDPFVNTGDDPALMPSGGVCPVPDDANIVADMNEWVNMKRLLTSQAVAAFLANSDPLFESGNNTYFLDFNDGSGRKRMYSVWDIDASFKSTTRDFYYTGSSETYEEVILQNPVFRSQYNQIMRDLLDGPLSEASIHAFLDDINTPELAAAIAADPYNQIGGDVPGRVAELKIWLSDRIKNVRNQMDWDEPILPPGIVLLDDGFEGGTWDANWTNVNWLKDTGVYAHGSTSAKGDVTGTLTCIDLDAGDATAIHIDFWFRKKGTEDTDFTLFYYNGTDYINVAELNILGGDSEWLHYTDTITDSQYFVSDFRIRLDAALGGGEDVWVDDVAVTKEAPMVILGYILDSGATPIDGVSVDANNVGGSDTTDSNGFYELSVPFDWSGTVTPTKAGYTFEPNNRSYANVTEDQTDQDYTATLLTYTISGTVTVGASGLGGVTMAGLPGSPVTEANGFYSDTVPFDWSGTVTPTKAGYAFEPNNRSYANVTEDQTEQNYTATLLTYTISGTVTLGGSGLDGVTMNGLPGSPVTSGGGLYSDTVPYGWSGTVTPTKEDYTFEPANRIYGNVTDDQTGQDYAATSIYDLDANGFINLGDLKILCTNWLSSGAGDFDEDGTVAFDDFAEFADAWKLR